jgi:hypothetical protein
MGNIPILNYLLGLAAALCLAPFSLIFPGLLWMHDFKRFRAGSMGQKFKYAMHMLLVFFGIYMTAGGM